MLLLILLFGCISKHIPSPATSTLGVVDIKNGNSCEINIDAENIIWIDGKFCSFLKEGDIILVERK